MDLTMDDVEDAQGNEDQQSPKVETADEKKRRIEAFYEAQPKGVFRVGYVQSDPHTKLTIH